MNNRNIDLFNYVYSSSFEPEKDDNLKWDEFKKICFEKMKYSPHDFIIENEILLKYDKKWIIQDITGNKLFGGKFVFLNFNGQKQFIDYKVNELKSIIDNYGKDAFNNLGSIFNYMCNEAIREILVESRNRKFIQYNDEKTFLYADDRLYEIFYDNIKVIINDEGGVDKNILINFGENIINQLGNNNTATITNSTDKELFSLIEEKLDAIKVELKNRQIEDQLIELEKAINKRDKKNVLEIITQFANIGSFIAAVISIIYKM